MAKPRLPTQYGEMLEKLLKRRGVSQLDLSTLVRQAAPATRINQATLSRVISGHQSVPLAWVAPIAQTLNLDARQTYALATAATEDHGLTFPPPPQKEEAPE